MSDNAPRFRFATATPNAGGSAPTETPRATTAQMQDGRGASDAGADVPSGTSAGVSTNEEEIAPVANDGNPVTEAGSLGVVGSGEAAFAALKAHCGLGSQSIAAALLVEAESRAWGGFVATLEEVNERPGTSSTQAIMGRYATAFDDTYLLTVVESSIYEDFGLAPLGAISHYTYTLEPTRKSDDFENPMRLALATYSRVCNSKLSCF